MTNHQFTSYTLIDWNSRACFNEWPAIFRLARTVHFSVNDFRIGIRGEPEDIRAQCRGTPFEQSGSRVTREQQKGYNNRRITYRGVSEGRPGKQRASWPASWTSLEDDDRPFFPSCYRPALRRRRTATSSLRSVRSSSFSLWINTNN